MIKIFASIVLLLAYIAPCGAAQLQVAELSKGGPRAILMSGDIVAGDYARLETILKSSGSLPVVEIMLRNSNGGDLVEALRIGRLINQLSILIIVGGDCYSACSFIAVGAKQRRFMGSVGLHRPYFNKAHFAKLTPREAEQQYRDLYLATELYLNENYIDQRVADQLFGTPSDKMIVLDAIEARETLGEYQPPFEEWLLSFCPKFQVKCVQKKVIDAQIQGWTEMILSDFDLPLTAK